MLPTANGDGGWGGDAPVTAAVTRTDEEEARRAARCSLDGLSRRTRRRLGRGSRTCGEVLTGRTHGPNEEEARRVVAGRGRGKVLDGRTCGEVLINMYEHEHVIVFEPEHVNTMLDFMPNENIMG